VGYVKLLITRNSSTLTTTTRHYQFNTHPRIVTSSFIDLLLEIYLSDGKSPDLAKTNQFRPLIVVGTKETKGKGTQHGD
jgi:hypothetical protein